MFKLYDSLSKTFKILDTSKTINIYNCGPTVYNHIHIGNARPLIIFDVLYRYLISNNCHVNYVLNITDIDDKIINKAISENKTEIDISSFFTNEYLKIKKQLNTLEMKNYKVSEHIDDIINYIQILIDKGYAYISNNDVYFDTSKIKDYGSLSNNNIEDLIANIRIENKDNKKNPTDFVLWKQTDVGLKWKTKFGEGRPGWHTECSCLINKYLGDSIDIHGGGMDLKFPHHENENAQNLALVNKGLANIWLHIGMINIDNKKMSKSLNNFILVKDILLKYPYQVLRWFFYQTNFANPLNYSNEAMDNIYIEIKKIESTINKTKSILVMNNLQFNFDLNNIQLENDFKDQIENNLNLANCITYILNMIKKINNLLRSKDFDNLTNLYKTLIKSLNILGIEFDNLHNDENITLLKQYKNYLDNKEFNKSDNCREKLIKLGLL